MEGIITAIIINLDNIQPSSKGKMSIPLPSSTTLRSLFNVLWNYINAIYCIWKKVVRSDLFWRWLFDNK